MSVTDGLRRLAGAAVRSRSSRRLVVSMVLAVAIAAALAGPEPANAQFDPTGGLGGIVGAGLDSITGGIGGAAVDGFGAILQGLFAWPAKLINRGLLAWLVAVPDYAIAPRTARGAAASSNLAELADTTSAMAFAALAAVGTVAGVRYWAAGLSGSGGFEAFEGLARMLVAALTIVLWPWLFTHAATLANAAASGLLGTGTVLDDTSRLLSLAFGLSVSLNFFAIVIACGAGLLFLGLLLCKIAVSASTALIFVAMPLALLLWVIPELAWVARTAMRAFAVVLVIPLAWALCFATFAAVGVDALALKGSSSFGDTLIMPLVALALLWLTVVLPRTLARMALFGAGSGGSFAGRTVSYVVARRSDAAISGAASGTAPGARPGTSGAANAGPAGGQRGGRLAGAATAAAATVATGGAAAVAAGGATAAGAGSGTASRALSSPAGTPWTAPAAAGAGPSPAARSAGGLPTPPWRAIRDRMPLEIAAAEARAATTSPQDVARAMGELTPQARAGVIELMGRTGGQIRGGMAQQAARDDLGEREREAFRTLAAATPQVRALGLEQLGAHEARSSQSTDDPGGAAPSAAVEQTSPAITPAAGPAVPGPASAPATGPLGPTAPGGAGEPGSQPSDGDLDTGSDALAREVEESE